MVYTVYPLSRSVDAGPRWKHFLQEESVPHRKEIAPGEDYFSRSIILIADIRGSLPLQYGDVSDEELMIAGIFLMTEKPGRSLI